MAENEQQPRRPRFFSLSYIFSFLLIVGIIVTVVVLMFGGNKSNTLSQAEFVDALGNNRITEVTETPKGSDLVVLEGYYTQPGKDAKKKFVTRFTAQSYFNEMSYTYKADGSNEWYLDIKNYDNGIYGNINAGVLSEDGIWNTLEEYKELKDLFK